MKKYQIYLGCIDILQLYKNETNDFKIIQMSYLQYLMEVVLPNTKDNIAEYKLRTLISLCLGEDYIGFVKDSRGKWNIAICDEESTIKNLINPADFDNIMLLILNQNDAHYDNRYVDHDVRLMVQEYYRIKYANVNMPSLEKRKAFVASKLSKTFKELGEMSIREFELIYKACVDSEMYLATKITEASYKYDIKNPSQHPLYESERDVYEEAFSSTDTLQGKGFKGAEQIGVGID